MNTLKVIVCLTVCCLLPVSAFGLSGVPSLELSTAETAFTGPGVPLVMVVPDGSGTPLTAACDENGNPVDATITLILRDSAGWPITHFPSEDIWLDTGEGGMNPCIGGAIADQNTDASGMTYWSAPLKAGGYSEGPVFVMVNGSALTSNAGLPLRFRSPDINGSLRVSLDDIAILAQDYFSSTFQGRSDMNNDGILNLTDIQQFAISMGRFCR